MTSFIHYSWEKLRDFVDAVLPALNAIMNIDFVISYPSIWTVLGLMPLWGKSSRQPAEGKCLGLKKVMRNSKTIVLLFHVLLRRGLIILWVLMNVWFTTATYLPIHSYCEFEITITLNFKLPLLLIWNCHYLSTYTFKSFILWVSNFHC